MKIPTPLLLAVVISLGSAGAPGGMPQTRNDDDAQLPSPTFPAVVALMKEPAKALSALDRAVAGRGDVPIEALVLRAHLLSDLHRYEQSVPLWDDVARREPTLGNFADRSAIADLLAARDLSPAATRVTKIVGTKPGRDDDPLLLTLADAYEGAGQHDAAAEIFRGVIAREGNTPVADRARLGLANSLEASGQMDGALATFHAATITWRLPDTYSTAVAEERRLAGRLHREPSPLSDQQYLTVAERLAGASCFDDANALLEAGLKEGRLTSSDKVEAAIIDNLYRGRHDDAAMARASQFLVRFPRSDFAPSIRLVQLRLEVRLGRVAQARSRLTALQGDKSVPAAVRQSDQRLVAAILVAAGPARDGLALYRGLLRGRLTRADRFDVSWRAGIAALRAGDSRAAIDLLRQARKYASARSTPRSTLYWLAAALETSGDAGEARRDWAQLAAENAYDYYGIRATERLKRAGATVPPAGGTDFPSVAVGEAAAASSEFQSALVLARAGLFDDASSMFRAAASRFRTDAGVALLAARAATAAGNYATAAALVGTRFADFLARPSAGMPADVWQMAFPRAYWDEVDGAARKSAVDPLLLLSLMRRESRFVATARSRTGAVGLFQIMPYTAREIVPVAEDTRESDSLLNAPASAELAARLVKRILGRFGGATAPVVAAYNAGEDRVADWWRASKGLNEDLFVDSIPYGETRQYVREVLANYATYKRLYGEAAPRN